MIIRLSSTNLSLAALLLWALLFANNALASTLITERHALVIGNSNYDTLTSLKNPEADAVAVANMLSSLGFRVEVVQNSTLKSMRQSVRTFVDRLNSNSAALVYYAGHGVQNEGINYLLPTDADIQETWQLPDEALTIDSIIRALDDSQAPLRIMMLDACRDNPLEYSNRLTRSTAASGGLAQAVSSYGTILSYSTQPDNVALDGDDAHSPYTSALLRRLPTADISIGDMFNLVGNDVVNATASKQQPWQSSSPIPEFCFAGCRSPGSENELAYLINGFRDNFRLGETEELENQVPLSDHERTQLEKLFGQYRQIRIKTVEVNFTDNGLQAVVLLHLTEAMTKENNRVTPAANWRVLTLLANKNTGRWAINGIHNEFLSADPADEAIDINAPRINLSTLELNPIKNNGSVIRIQIEDNNSVDAAALYYRNSGTTSAFRSTPLEYSDAEDSFKATVTGGNSISGNTEYYFEATDTHGNRTKAPDFPASDLLTHGTIKQNADKKTKHSNRRWWYIGLGILATGALAAQASSSGEESNSGARPVTITTVLP